MRRWFVAALCAALGVGVGLPVAHAVVPGGKSVTTSGAGQFDRDHGQPADAFAVPSLSGPGEVSLAALRGRPVVVNFWASWCPPCRGEMPAMQAASRRLAGQVRFVGIDTNDQRGNATAFLRTTGVSYRVGFDPNATVAAHYGVYGLPTTFFISPTGKLLGHQVGGLSEARLIALIHQLYPTVR